MEVEEFMYRCGYRNREIDYYYAVLDLNLIKNKFGLEPEEFVELFESGQITENWKRAERLGPATKKRS